MGVMTPNIEKERAIEAFRSLIQISVEGFKLLALLNGGAAVALLAYLGSIAGKTTQSPDMRLPMICYLSGLVFCVLAVAASYLTQFWLYNESQGREGEGRHMRWLWVCVIVALLSLASFTIGSYVAASRFR
jgi:hypothetical protein